MTSTVVDTIRYDTIGEFNADDFNDVDSHVAAFGNIIQRYIRGQHLRGQGDYAMHVT